jgi:hypothetical protein
MRRRLARSMVSEKAYPSYCIEDNYDDFDPGLFAMEYDRPFTTLYEYYFEIYIDFSTGELIDLLLEIPPGRRLLPGGRAHVLIDILSMRDNPRGYNYNFVYLSDGVFVTWVQAKFLLNLDGVEV